MFYFYYSFIISTSQKDPAPSKYWNAFIFLNEMEYWQTNHNGYF